MVILKVHGISRLSNRTRLPPKWPFRSAGRMQSYLLRMTCWQHSKRKQTHAGQTIIMSSQCVQCKGLLVEGNTCSILRDKGVAPFPRKVEIVALLSRLAISSLHSKQTMTLARFRGLLLGPQVTLDFNFSLFLCFVSFYSISMYPYCFVIVLIYFDQIKYSVITIFVTFNSQAPMFQWNTHQRCCHVRKKHHARQLSFMSNFLSNFNTTLCLWIALNSTS